MHICRYMVDPLSQPPSDIIHNAMPVIEANETVLFGCFAKDL